MSDYPEKWSDCEITFDDGQVVTHRIKVGSGFAIHMARQVRETGILVLLCGPQAHCFPIDKVRNWTLIELSDEEMERMRNGTSS